MNTDTKKEMKDKTKYLKLLEAHNNNIEISNYNLGNKYTDFEISKLDKSLIHLKGILVDQ